MIQNEKLSDIRRHNHEIGVLRELITPKLEDIKKFNSQISQLKEQ